MTQSHKLNFIISLLSLSIFLSLACKFEDEVTNYLGTDNNITFGNIKYKLAWSSHPNAQYYKQEYVPEGDNVSKFHNMIMLDFIQRDIPVLDAVTSQINILEKRKKNDINCHYQLIHNADSSEYILDFLMSDISGSVINIVEWNAYRYKAYTDKAGHKGVLLFGVSNRAYDKEAAAFFTSLNEFRDKHKKALIKFTIPEIQLK
jgi:hypothetical protein